MQPGEEGHQARLRRNECYEHVVSVLVESKGTPNFDRILQARPHTLSLAPTPQYRTCSTCI